MIRLNEMLERGTRHRWLGPAFVVLRALLLALVVLHTAADQATETGVVCLAILMILIAILLPAPNSSFTCGAPARLARRLPGGSLKPSSSASRLLSDCDRPGDLVVAALADPVR